MSNTISTRPSAYRTYDEYFTALRSLASQYGDLPSSAFYSAWAQAAMLTNPYVQNNRVKRVSTLPGSYNKQQIVDMLKAPQDNERALRSVGASLEWTAFPYRKIRATYQNINTCKYYHYPAYLTKEEAKSPTVRREGVLLDKFNRRLRPDAWARQLIGEAWKEGKVFYTPRYSVDKAHNAVNHAFLQKLPSDWCKIVGFNSESKYTVMFNMMYFMEPGTDWRQFGDLFEPYMEDFAAVVETEGRSYGRTVYAERGRDGFPGFARNDRRAANDRPYMATNGRRCGLNLDMMREGAYGNPMAYSMNGKWYYWVTLPAERVWTFEIDDTSLNVAPMASGLFLSFSQISDVEDVALAVMQNPLVSIAFGEIPYYSDKNGTNAADPTKLSPTGREFYLNEWAQMLAACNAGGIAFFPAPMSNLHLETLPEATGSSEMTTKQYGYAVLKSGMSGLVPINSDPRAGAVEISAKLEEQMCSPVYTTFSRMMERIYRDIGTKFEWRFSMFGGFVSDAADLENARQGMSLGILSETMKYLALRGFSFWEDMGISQMVAESGVMELRVPLVSSFHASAGDLAFPPGAGDKGGRPTKDIDQALAEGGEAQEADLDG